MQHIFREYDIRGIYEKDLNEKSIKIIGFLLGKKISKFHKSVAVGYDARTHSPQIFRWLISGLNKAGIKVKSLGLVPTPCTYFASYSQDNASVMITGSHNPPEYNGLKITINKLPFFAGDIAKLGEEAASIIDTLDIKDDFSCENVDFLYLYINFLIKHFYKLKDLDKDMVIDCGNGVAGVVLPKVCKELNLRAKILFAEPDGNFPNHHPDPTQEENLIDIKKQMSGGSFDIGFAFDGDVDRLAVLTNKRNIKGDELAILYSKMMNNPIVIGEVKCSQIMYDEINKIGTAHMYKTGHSNLKVKIKELGAHLAAEVSGHIFFADRYFGYDDAIYAMLRTLELLHAGLDLDLELEKLPTTYSTEELKIKTTENRKFDEVAKLKEVLQNPPEDFPKIRDIIDVDGVRVIFENGWGLIRASNTTPVLVARFEANSKEDMSLYQEKMQKVVEDIQKLNI